MNNSAGPERALTPEARFAMVITGIIRAAGYRSQREFAKELKVSQGSICNYCRPNSGKKPGHEMIRRIAQFCGQTAAKRTEYEQAMLRARAHYVFPRMSAEELSIPTIPLGMPAVFRQRIEQDMVKHFRRRLRDRLMAANVPWRLLNRVLQGEAILTVEQVRRVAQVLGASEEIYLALANEPTQDFHRMISGQHDLLAALLSMPPASRKDLELVFRSSRNGSRLKRKVKSRVVSITPRPVVGPRGARGGRTH